MGRTRLTVRTRQGHTGCEGTVWESETSVRCRVAVGASGHQKNRLNGRIASREHEPGMVCRHGCCQQAAHLQSGRDRLGVCDGAWCGVGRCATDGEGSGGAHGMRGHRLGVGDVGEVSSEPWGFWDPSSGDDGGITAREHEPGLVCGQWMLSA
jgi:hypothetical protein